jgi:hypothetical protein
MIKKVLTICHGFGDFKMEYEKEFLVPVEIKAPKAVGVNTTIAAARNGLAVGHRRRGDVGVIA